MSKVVKTVKRVAIGVVTGGLSEVARFAKKKLTPKVAAIPGVPTSKNSSKELEAAGKLARKDKRRGRASTILTGRQGVAKDALG